MPPTRGNATTFAVGDGFSITGRVLLVRRVPAVIVVVTDVVANEPTQVLPVEHDDMVE